MRLLRPKESSIPPTKASISLKKNNTIKTKETKNSLMATPDELFLFELNNIFIETKKPMAKNGFLDPYINITTEPIIAAISASLFFESKYAFNCQSTDKSSTFDIVIEYVLQSEVVL